MKKVNLLIVDDEPELRNALTQYFELEDYNCFTAENGAEAIKIIKQRPIDFVITDLRMPGGDGVQLLKDIKQYNSDAPKVLVMTGFSEIERNEVLELGALDMIGKPVELDQIADLIDRNLNN